MTEEDAEEHPVEEPPCLKPGAPLSLLSDEQLLYYFDRLHHPDLVVESPIEALQNEITKRGLRRPS